MHVVWNNAGHAQKKLVPGHAYSLFAWEHLQFML